MARNWLPLLLTTFLATPPNQRTQLEVAVSAYACITDASTLAQFFRAAITKLIKARGQGARGPQGADGRVCGCSFAGTLLH